MKNISSVYSNAYKNSPVLVLGTFDIVFRIVGRSRAYTVSLREFLNILKRSDFVLVENMTRWC